MNKKDLKIMNQMIKLEEKQFLETSNKIIAKECEIRLELLKELKSKLTA